jgi:sulfotransferase
MSEMKIVFNSSLPRSGSTVLQNLLAQNPRFHCSGTSGVLELLYAARQNFTNLDEFKLNDDPATMQKAWLGFCRSALEGFYSAITDKPVACDKSRGWMYYHEWLSQFYPNPKIICCIRDPRAILASMEKLHRKNMHLADPADQPAKMQMVNIESRVAHWLTTPPVGLGLQRLRDAVLKGNIAKFCIVPYNDLLECPASVMAKIYEYIEEEPFEHNFNQIEQTIKENDALHGVYGDHQIRNEISGSNNGWEKIIGPAISEQVGNDFKWMELLK